MESLIDRRWTEAMNLTTITTVTTATTALGAATFGGVLFAFSTFVMPGLDAAPPPSAVATMQQINRAAPRSLLAFDMVATLALCVVVAVLAVLQLRHGRSASGAGGGASGELLLLVGVGLYVVSFAITAIYHIPRNNAFDNVVANGPHAARDWHDYARPWELWNHVRAGAALAGAASMVAGMVAGLLARSA
jgi:uncharacterized membrane protein